MSKEKLLFCVGAVEKEHGVSIGNETVDLKLNWAEDMVGAMPVFKNRDAAIKYAEDKFTIFEIKVVSDKK